MQTFGDSDPQSLFSYLLEQLNSRELAYVHLIEPRGFHRQSKIQQPEDVTKLFRKAYKVCVNVKLLFMFVKFMDCIQTGFRCRSPF